MFGHRTAPLKSQAEPGLDDGCAERGPANRGAGPRQSVPAGGRGVLEHHEAGVREPCAVAKVASTLSARVAVHNRIAAP